MNIYQDMDVPADTFCLFQLFRRRFVFVDLSHAM